MDGSVVPASDYSITDKGKLVLSSVPHQPFELETIVEIKPQVYSLLDSRCAYPYGWCLPLTFSPAVSVESRATHQVCVLKH